MLPAAVAVILPVAGVEHPSVGVELAVTVISTPVHVGEGSVRMNCLVPVQPSLLRAVTVYVPAARLVKFPLAWKFPLFNRKVKPAPPVADAEIDPSAAPVVDGFELVPATTTVTPAQGSSGPSPPLPLLQAITISVVARAATIGAIKVPDLIFVLYDLIARANQKVA